MNLVDPILYTFIDIIFMIRYSEKAIRCILFINKLCNITVLLRRVRERTTVLAATGERSGVLELCVLEYAWKSAVEHDGRV